VHEVDECKPPVLASVLVHCQEDSRDVAKGTEELLRCIQVS
jgi:hypothetical protein